METYRKNTSPSIDAELRGADAFGSILLGTTRLFHKKLLKVTMLPLSEITRAWRRVEEIRAKTGCCSNDFSIHHLMLETRGGETLSLKIGEALYRHEPEALLAALESRAPHITIGKP